MYNYAIGLDKFEIDTPALLLDLDKLDYNVEAMAQFFEGQEADLRPHMKTHKSPIISHRQIKAGAIGVTCQKTGEAEVMARSGIDDILIANEVVGKRKVRRVANLAKTVDLKVAVDSERNVKELGKAARAKRSNVGVLVEINLGMDRCGVPPGEPALKLARKVHDEGGLSFLGIMGYEGHAVFIESFEERKQQTEKALEKEIETKELLESSGLECQIVTSGATGTYDITGTYPGVTEVEAGSYATMDLKYGTVEGVDDGFKQGVTLLATVISRPTDDRAILDLGMKAVTHDKGKPSLLNINGATVDCFAEEHTYLNVLDREAGQKLQLGEKVELIPSHGCTTINLHDHYFCTRDGKVEAVWPIEARGKFV